MKPFKLTNHGLMHVHFELKIGFGWVGNHGMQLPAAGWDDSLVGLFWVGFGFECG
jgi:hypothetical protein